MEATSLLKEDHQKVRALFRKFEAAGERAYQTKKGLYEDIKSELDIHAQIEEQIFYPAVRDMRSKEGGDLVAEAVEEHTIVKRLLSELEDVTPQDEEFDAKMKVLMENVEHHADEEEKEMFPEAKRVLGADRLEELGLELEEMKESLKSQLVART
jgi:hemerythrin-like domain-containing protein